MLDWNNSSWYRQTKSKYPKEEIVKEIGGYSDCIVTLRYFLSTSVSRLPVSFSSIFKTCTTFDRPALQLERPNSVRYRKYKGDKFTSLSKCDQPSYPVFRPRLGGLLLRAQTHCVFLNKPFASQTHT